MIGIYAIHNKINDKYYIGQTKNINQRWIQHRSRLKCHTHENCHLQASYDLYGVDNFEYLVLEECAENELDKKEQYYIEKYNAYTNGYNLDKGGAGCIGYKHTEEEIAKMRLIQNPKAVLQIDMQQNIVAEWVSCSHAGKTLGLSVRGIKAVCNRVNRQKTIGGYYWIYKEEYDENTVDWDYYLNINKSSPKRISQYDRNMKLIKIWNSIYEASITEGFESGSISMVANYKRNTYKDYVWRFTDTYTQEQYLKDLNTMMNLKTTKKKVVEKYDMNGNFVCEYPSITQTIKNEKIDGEVLRKCLNGNILHYHGYVYKLAV